MRPAWHALLAPLPEGSVPKRAPVAVAGWQQLSLELSAGDAGLRHVLLVLDGKGEPVAVSDWVMVRADHERVRYVHENLGGRFERGKFRGARWRLVSVEDPVSLETETAESMRSTPSAADVEAVKSLVTDLLRRARP